LDWTHAGEFFPLKIEPNLPLFGGSEGKSERSGTDLVKGYQNLICKENTMKRETSVKSYEVRNLLNSVKTTTLKCIFLIAWYFEKKNTFRTLGQILAVVRNGFSPLITMTVTVTDKE
jgi:hypothetical protein